MTKTFSLAVAGLVAIGGCDSGPTSPTPQPSSAAVSISIGPATDLLEDQVGGVLVRNDDLG